MEFTLLYYAGLALVVIYALDRFNTPTNSLERSQLSWKKYSTTSTKYYTGLALYIITYMILYHLIIHFGKEPLQAQLNPSLKGLPIELLSTLTLTTLLPSITGIKEFDTLIKQKIYQLVNIPLEVQFMARRIEESKITINEKEHDLIITKFIEQGIDADKLNDSIDDSIVIMAIKAQFLISQLTRCLSKNSYKDFSLHYSSNVGRLNDQYEDVLLLLKTYINSNNEAIREDKTIFKKINKDTEQVFKDVCNLISMAVISRITSDNGRIERLQTIGITIKGNDTRFSWDMIALIFMGIFMLYFLKYTFEPYITGKNRTTGFMLSIQIAIAYCIAVFWALQPKSSDWELARKNTEHRNYRYYLVVAFLTFFTYAIVRLLFSMSPDKEFIELISGHFLSNMPYQIPSVMTAILLCFIIDTDRHKPNRYVDMSIGIFALPIFLFLAKQIISINTGIDTSVTADTGVAPLTTEEDSSTGNEMDLLDTIVSALAGALIFYNIPYWYRQAAAHHKKVNAEDTAASPHPV